MPVVFSGQSLGARDQQEDAVRIVFQNEASPQGDILMLLADGMGGHAGGEVASQLALDVFERHFTGGAQGGSPAARLHEGLERANQAIAERVKSEPRLQGMGCTLIAALKHNHQLIWVSVGDSPMYLLRGGQLQRLNDDHSVHGELMDLVRAGKMTQAEADSHPRRNALRSALIGGKLSLVDQKSISLQDGDIVLLASDGIDTLTPAEIADGLRRGAASGPQRCVEGLLEAVSRKQRPRQDNTSLIALTHSPGGVAAHSIAVLRHSPLAVIAAAAVALLAIIGLALVLLGGKPDPAPDVQQTPAPAPASSSSSGKTGEIGGGAAGQGIDGDPGSDDEGDAEPAPESGSTAADDSAADTAPDSAPEESDLTLEKEAPKEGGH